MTFAELAAGALVVVGAGLVCAGLVVAFVLVTDGAGADAFVVAFVVVAADVCDVVVVVVVSSDVVVVVVVVVSLL